MATQRSRFTLAATPRCRDRSRSANDVPRVAQLTIDEGHRPQRAPQRLPEEAPVEVVLYKVSNKAGDLWSKFEGTEEVLYQVQMKHEARPSALFDLVRSFNQFLRDANQKDSTIPTSLAELQNSGIRLVCADEEDPDDVGFIQWRAAIYVAGLPDQNPLTNCLLLLDDFWKFKAKELAPRTIEIQLHPHIGVDIASVWDDLEHDY